MRYWKSKVKPRSEAPAEIFRASGQATCSVCGLEFRSHEQVVFTDDPDHDQFPIIVVVTCNGKMWHL